MLKYFLLLKMQYKYRWISRSSMYTMNDEQCILIIQGILNWYDRRNSEVIHLFFAYQKAQLEIVINIFEFM